MTGSASISKVFTMVPELCTGCHICEMACVMNKTGRINLDLARIKVIQPEKDGPYTPIICRHCKKAPCLEACPVPGAMTQDKKSGVVLLDEKKCTRCLACVKACPFDAIQVSPEGQVLKCDLCGGDPVCVKFCPWIPEHRVPKWPWPKQSCLQYAGPEQLSANRKRLRTG